MNTQPDQLLPCPGCGLDNTRVIGGPGSVGGPKYWAGCDTCRWRTWGTTEAQAIAAWNIRTPPPAQGVRVTDAADRIVRDVAELPDRTSPEDWPEAMLVTPEELRGIVQAAIASDDERAAEAGIERVAALLHEEATDEPWTICGEEHPGVDRAYYRKLARKIVAALTDGEQAGEGGREAVPVGWWNGIRPDTLDRSGYHPSIRWGADSEDGRHDIPLYAGYNPIHHTLEPDAGAAGAVGESLLDVLRAMGSASTQCYNFARRIEAAIIADGQRRATRPAAEAAGDGVELREQIAKLQAFKDYVHERLDEAGIPPAPPSPHLDAGCRIGARLDIALASPPAAAVPEGYYIASFKHSARGGGVLWWMPKNCGYTPDLAQAGIYAEPEPGYHDNDYTVPVPVAFIRNLRVRSVIDPGDTLNRAFHSAKALRAVLAAAPQPDAGKDGAA